MVPPAQPAPVAPIVAHVMPASAFEAPPDEKKVELERPYDWPEPDEGYVDQLNDVQVPNFVIKESAPNKFPELLKTYHGQQQDAVMDNLVDEEEKQVASQDVIMADPVKKTALNLQLEKRYTAL